MRDVEEMLRRVCLCVGARARREMLVCRERGSGGEFVSLLRRENGTLVLQTVYVALCLILVMRTGWLRRLW
jgi:hypothetical protein